MATPAQTSQVPQASATPNPAFAGLEIETPRLLLRTLVDADTISLHDFVLNKANFPHQPVEEGLAVERLRRRITSFRDSTAKGEDGFLGFFLKESDGSVGELVGYGGYNTFESVVPGEFYGNKDAEQGKDSATAVATATAKQLMTDFGIMLDHRFWRQGFGTEILDALIDYASNKLGVVLFRTETALENAPYIALIRANGLGSFEREQKASYDETQVVKIWSFGVGDWKERS